MEVGASQLSKFTAQQAQELIRLFERIPLDFNAAGNVVFSPALPTTEPAAVGALYTNTNVLTISNGP